MKRVAAVITVLILASLPQFGMSESDYLSGEERDIVDVRRLRKAGEEKPQFNHIPKRPGHYTAEDWRAVIDSTWGEGLPTETKLGIFDYFWKEVDEKYPSFHNISVNWDSLSSVYRPEVAGGVSRGRFYAIMCQMSLALQDMHTYICDLDVASDDLELGVPLLVSHGYQECGHFGAGLSPLPDSSLLVYDVVSDHPLGLERGDIVLGYDDIPWKILYKELIKAELPIWMPGWGGSDLSSTHIWLTSAGENWHLFDTIDIVKYDSGDTLHFSTSALENQEMQFFSSAQMPIRGVPFPDIENDHWVSWGLIEDTQIGYIYAWNWMPEWEGYHSTGNDFRQAIVTLMNDYDTKGLILDSRRNTGGLWDEYEEGLIVLFSLDQDIFVTFKRGDPNDHFAMEQIIGSFPASTMVFKADERIYDKPIAVLTGPASGSCGDFMPLQMRYHPMVRIFGLPTNSAFGDCIIVALNYSDEWELRLGWTDSYLKESPGEYLTHVGFEVDEEVWLTQEDVARGEDTVVNRAVEWINNLAYSHDVRVDPTYVEPGRDTLTVTATVENPNQHELSISASITQDDNVLVDSFDLFDDGKQNDGSAGDGIWGGKWTLAEEGIFHVSLKTEDLTSGTSRTLPMVGHFTPYGPVIVESYTITPSDTVPGPGDELDLTLTLKNLDSEVTVEAIEARVVSLDPFATVTTIKEGTYPFYGSIAPGESATALVERLSKYWIKIADNCPGNIDIPFRVDISSDNYTLWSDSFSIYVEGPVAVAEDTKTIPLEFALHQNYPNPFNPRTLIKYQLPVTSQVELSIYGVLGQKVAKLASEQQSAGYYEVEWDGSDLASGLYFVEMKAGDFTKVNKAVLLK